MWGAADRDQRCRTCGYQRETLPHVLCHCMARSAMYTARHNAVVARLRKAAAREFTVAFENRPVGDTGLRPDLVLVRGEEALILDVACPFENTPEAFSNARNDKMAKYEPVAAYLRRRYQRVTVGAVIVGALGAWDPANDRVLQRLCSRTYLRLFKKVCVSDVVAGSRRVYHAHVRNGRP
ncbi:hypothetical protein MTO96_000298 [Rhipicephalus appendiculatus]